jgi:hypothetical protein
MPRRPQILIGCLAAACAGCASPQPAPEPGPVYATAGLRERGVDLVASPQSLAGAKWLQVRRRLELGEVPYDGLTLPLFSPDARFIATQLGPAPDWAAMLGERSSAIPEGQIRVYQINADSPQPLTPGRLLPAGLLLGRAASADGFLVESPSRDELPRRIGLADWSSDHIEWLTSADSDAAFAAIAPDGTFAYSTREPGAEGWALVLRTPGGGLHTISLRDESLVLPVIVSDRGDLIVFSFIVPHQPGAPLALAAFRPTPGESSSHGSLEELARVQFAAAASIADAFQSIAGAPAFVEAGRSGPHMLAFSSAASCIEVVKLTEQDRRELTREPLVPGTFAAVSGRAGGRDGIVACTVADTIYWDLETLAAANRQFSPEPALVWPGPGVPRWLGGQEWPLAILFMQTSNDGNAFRVVLIGSGAAQIPQ